MSRGIYHFHDISICCPLIRLNIKYKKNLADAHEDTVFARINHSISLGEGVRLSCNYAPESIHSD